MLARPIMELLNAMEVFVTVAEVGSFTKAADALQLNRPQATLAIQELEASLGARLLHRTTRKVSLTTEGEAFYERAKDILANVSAATSMFGGQGGALRGRLRIDMPAVFGQGVFMGALAEFTERHPDIELAIGVTDRLVDLVAEGVDCAVRIGELASSSLVAKRVGGVVQITCASPHYLKRMGAPSSLEDLVAHRGVQFLSGVNKRPLPWRFSEQGVERDIGVKGKVSVNDTNAYVQAGVAGFGILQLPGFMVGRELADGSLVEVLPAHRPKVRPVSVVYPSRSHVAPQVSAFVDWFSERFATLHPTWLIA